MKQYVIIRQSVMDDLIAKKAGDVHETSLKRLTVIDPLPQLFFEHQPHCPFGCGVFKVQKDFDTLHCVAADWDTSD